jgi:hypothetical protein
MNMSTIGTANNRSSGFEKNATAKSIYRSARDTANHRTCGFERNATANRMNTIFSTFGSTSYSTNIPLRYCTAIIPVLPDHYGSLLSATTSAVVPLVAVQLLQRRLQVPFPPLETDVQLA